MTRTLLALTLALASLPSLALAQDPARVEVFDDADQVTGTLQSPLLDEIAVRGRHPRHTLLTPRPHYIPEMLRSVENL